jgi:hypothetical protein
MRPEDDGISAHDANHPMDFERIIDELRLSLEQVTSEEKVFDLITERLAALRQSFRSHKSQFTSSHIEFLKSVAAAAGPLQSFIELREELAYIDTLEDYTAMVGRLVNLKGKLAPFAVCQRVKKELRELNEKLPAIREQDEGKRQVMVNTRIIDLERHAPRCRRNHAMAIREGPYDYFWGCSRYPFCGEATQLTPEQRRRLDASNSRG